MTARTTTLKGVDAGLCYVEGLPSYYLDADEPAGIWRGDGAVFLGLVGEVQDEPFLDLMAGLEPWTDEALGRQYGEGSVRGYDVTASAPKSVSVLFALGDDATRAAVLDAHDRAVAAMVDWIEDHAHTRYRIDGQVATLDADGIATGSSASTPAGGTRALRRRSRALNEKARPRNSAPPPKSAPEHARDFGPSTDKCDLSRPDVLGAVRERLDRCRAFPGVEEAHWQDRKVIMVRPRGIDQRGLQQELVTFVRDAVASRAALDH